MARDYDHLFKLLIIGDSGKFGRWWTRVSDGCRLLTSPTHHPSPCQLRLLSGAGWQEPKDVTRGCHQPGRTCLLFSNVVIFQWQSISMCCMYVIMYLVSNLNKLFCYQTLVLNKLIKIEKKKKKKESIVHWLHSLASLASLPEMSSYLALLACCLKFSPSIFITCWKNPKKLVWLYILSAVGCSRQFWRWHISPNLGTKCKQ